MDPHSHSLSGEADALYRRALALPAQQREKFLQENVADPSVRSAMAARLEDGDQTRAWGSTSEVGQQGHNREDAILAEGTIAPHDGSTENAAANLDSGDYVTLPTIKGQPSSAPDSDGPIGQIGEYELLEEVARGGMGVVFKARHRVLDRLVAIKIPRAAQLEDEGEARFLREARAAAQLRHPHICPIYEVGHVGRQPFIALGFIEGPTLRQKLREPVKAREAAEIVAKVARAVHYAHERGVIHRDIKPSNIMLEADSGEPVLMDFGLAKQLSEGDSHVTKSGQVMGTPVYMAPEQAAGRHDKIGAKSDVYACGAVLYELLAGRPPFQGSTGEVIRQVQTDEPPAPRKLAPTIHRDLETICLKAMAKDPAARYASAQALAEDLDRFAAGEAILAKREGVVRRTVRLVRRNAKLAAAVLLVAVVGGAAAAYFAFGAREAQQLATINRQFHDGLQEASWDVSHRENMESLAAQLAAFDPAAAEEMRGQLSRAYGNQLRQRIADSPALRESDIGQIATDIAWLQERDAETAASLRRQLEARQRTWQPLFRLAAPYENRQDVFDDAIAVNDSLLEPRTTDEFDRPSANRVLTRARSLGNVQLRAVFDANWKTASEIGLLLHASDQRGYVFRLVSPGIGGQGAAGPVSKTPFWRHMEAGSKIDVQILRDGLLLRQTSVRANDAVDGQTGRLSLEATAEGQRVMLRVGRQPALVFEDVFPYVGGADQRFGVFWPAGVSLVSLKALEQPLPVAPSLLEEGDELFAQEQWSAALSQYRQQAGLTGDQRLRDRARFKEALCRVRLEEDDEARQIFESLTSTADEGLRLLAGCQLWLLHLQHERYADAEVVFESLQSQFDVEQLAMLVPEADRRDIIARTFRATTGLNLYRFTDGNLRFLQQAHRIVQLLNPNQHPNERGMFTWQLIRGFHVAGEIDQAVEIAHSYIAQNPDIDGSQTTTIVNECSWLLRQRGERNEARKLVDRHLGDREQADGRQLQFLVERARVSVAQEKWEEAADDLDFFLQSPARHQSYREFSAACLMRGLLYEREGNAAQASELWHRGLYENWQAESGGEPSRGPSLTGMDAANAMLLSALCGDRTDKQIVQLATQSFPAYNAGVTAQLVQQYSHVLAPALRNMGQSERGKRVIWEAAFQEVSLKEMTRNPANLIFLEVTRLGAAPGDWTPEEEQIVWDLMDRAIDLYASDEINPQQAVQLVLTWKGANNLFGWKGVAPSLDAKIRAPMAYVFGHRYLKLGKPADAREFFVVAAEDAADGSTLKELAEAKIAEISAGGVQ